MFLKSKNYRKSYLKSILFILPGVVLTVAFVIYPVVNTGIFGNYRGRSYVDIYSECQFWRSGTVFKSDRTGRTYYKLAGNAYG